MDYSYTYESKEGADPVDAVAKPLAFVGLGVLVFIALIVVIIVAASRKKKK